MDPSGTFVQYDAKAIGSGSEGAQQSLKVLIKVLNLLNRYNINLHKECKKLNLKVWFYRV